MSIRVLHVDDEPDLASTAAAFLERADGDLSVVAATDGAEALERFDREAIDGVVSDYDMVGMNGLELLARVRERDPDVPFVLFTGKGSEEIAAEAISKGVTDYLQKGGGTDQYTLLARRVRNAVEQRRAKARAERTRKFLEKVVEHATDAIAVVNSEHEIVFVSGSVEEVLGYTTEGITERGPFDFVHPEDRERVRDHFRSHLTDPGTPTGISFRAIHADGRTLRCRARVYNLVDDPDVEGMLVYTRAEADSGERDNTETDGEETDDATDGR